jgi:WD40 repeat protein
LTIFMLGVVACPPVLLAAEQVEERSTPQKCSSDSAAEHSTLGSDAGPSVCIAHELDNRHSEGVVWSSDGSKLAAFGDFGTRLTIWKNDGEVLRTFSRPQGYYPNPSGLAFVSQDRQLVVPPVSIRNEAVAFDVIDLNDGAIVHEAMGDHQNRQNNVNSIRAVAVSPDRFAIAVVFGYALANQPATIYSTKDWSKIVALPNPTSVLWNALKAQSTPSSVAFSRDGKMLAIGAGNQMAIYDWRTARLIRTIEPVSTSSIPSFSPDGQFIAVAGNRWIEIKHDPGDEKVTTPVQHETAIQVFRIFDGTLAAAFPTPLPFLFWMEWSPDGDLIAVRMDAGRDSTLLLWKPFDESVRPSRYVMQPDGVTLAFSPNGKYLPIDNDRFLTICSVSMR